MPCLKDLFRPYTECIFKIEKILNIEKLFKYGNA
jgi:hypothetical protein